MKNWKQAAASINNSPDVYPSYIAAMVRETREKLMYHFYGRFVTNDKIGSYTQEELTEMYESACIKTHKAIIAEFGKPSDWPQNI